MTPETPFQTSLFLAQATTPAEQTAPPIADIAMGVGILLGCLIVPHFIAAKMLAPAKATAGRVLGASIIHVIFGVILLIANLVLLFAAGAALPLGGLIGIILLSLIMAGIYGFGFWRGVLYNIVTSLAFAGIAILLGTVLSFEPVKKLLPFTSGAGAGLSEGAQGKPIEIGAKPRFATDKEAQAAAMQKYPALGVAGSPFNKRFIEVHGRLKREKPELLVVPDWPMVIADEVAVELGVK